MLLYKLLFKRHELTQSDIDLTIGYIGGCITTAIVIKIL